MIFSRAITAPTEVRPKRVLVYGDSVTWGWVPQATFIPSERFPPSQQWPLVMAEVLGPGVEVLVDALSGRTTDVDDPLVPEVLGTSLNGNASLPAVLGAYLPLDLVVLMLGSNDLKPQFGRTPFRIALGTGLLIDTIQRSSNLFDSFWYTYPAPQILLVCPPPLARPVKAARALFEGAEERGKGLSTAYALIAAAAGVPYFDAGTVVQSDGVDGVHLTGEAQRKLGLAMAVQVAALLATPLKERE